MTSANRVLRRRRHDGGVAAVEFAIVLPLLLLIVLGAIDWGWFFYVDQVVTNAAREGARAAAVEYLDGSDASSTATSTAGTYLTGAGLTDTGVAAAETTVDGSSAIEVEITYPVGSLSGLLTDLLPTNAYARAVMRLE